MATQKILTYDGLVEYNELVMTEISTGDSATLASAKSYADSLASGKSDSSHTHDGRYYTEAEIDSKVSTINSNITKITNGTTVVKNAEHATSADSATTATSATSAESATKATQDGNGKVISSTYETKTDASTKLTEAKAYADSVGATVKNDLLNGAGTAYDTLKELGDLIDDNADAIEALETIASGKADKTHSHAISDVSGLQSALDGKAASSHGTHVTWSTTSPKMNGTVAVGTEAKVARGDHVHPTDTSRASQVALDEHIGDTTKHITSTERTNWNAAKTHADSAHAPSNAEKNQNAFSNITVGSTTVSADSATDTVTFVGSNVTITPDATNDKITFAVADGTTSAKGIVQLTNSTSSTSTTTAATPNSVKSAYDLANQAKTAAATAQSTADGKANAAHTHKTADISDLTATATELNYMDGVTSSVQAQLDSKSDSGHGHSDASTSAAGFMTAAMVTKLNGIATGANKTVVDTSLSSSSTNPVQNKVVNSAISTVTNAINTNTSSINAHTTRISSLETKVGDGFVAITSAEIQSLFSA